MAGGDPVPKISWYFQGLPLNGKIPINDYPFGFPFCSKQSSPHLILFIFHAVTNKKYNATEAGLRLCNVSLSDAGEYVCKGYQISASLVKSKERVIRLKVNRKFSSYLIVFLHFHL